VSDVPAAGVSSNVHGRAGRNLPAAIGIGVGLGAYVVLSLVFFKPAFVLLVAVALGLASVELHQALRKQGMTSSIIPIVVGSLAISIGSYLAGEQRPVVFSTTSVLLAALALTVLASLIWRMPKGADGFVRDAAASLLIIGYVPMLGSFAALMLAEEQGGARLVTFLLVVAMNDTGGYVAGVLFGKHPMAPHISPKKSWEGFAGSLVFGIAAGLGMAQFAIHVP
jgi:phosphatidate cytidylyltransferase